MSAKRLTKAQVIAEIAESAGVPGDFDQVGEDGTALVQDDRPVRHLDDQVAAFSPAAVAAGTDGGRLSRAATPGR